MHWELDLTSNGQTVLEVRAQYQLAFEAAPHAWRALEASWPYLRQQTETVLAAQGLPHLLPVTLPIPSPEAEVAPAAPEAVLVASPLPETPSSELPTRTLPLTPRLTALFGVQAKLHRIVHGQEEWLLSATQLYAALLSATRSRKAGTVLEWHSRNDALQEAFFERVTGTTPKAFGVLEPGERRMLLGAARRTVVALFDDVLSKQSDLTTGQLMDRYQDDVEDLLDPYVPDDAVAASRDAGAPTTIDQSELYEFVIAPFRELGERELTPLEEQVPFGGPIKQMTVHQIRHGHRIDLVAVVQVIDTLDFEDPDPLVEDPPPHVPTLYRLRHLHVDHSADPPLVFLLDLNLDEAVAEFHSEQFDTELDEEIASGQWSRWGRSRELAQQPWPREGELLPLQDVVWVDSPDLAHFEAWLGDQPEGRITPEQWREAICVDGVNLIHLIRTGHLPVDVLTTLAEHPDPEVRSEVAAQGRLPVRVMEALWHDSDDVRMGLTENPNLPEDLQRRLAHVESDTVKGQLACNEHLLPELLVFLADDPFFATRCNVAGNPATPISVLRMLAEDAHAWVQEEAQKALAARV